VNPVERHPPSEIQRASLQWLLVFPEREALEGADYGNTTGRDRRRATETLQRQHHRRWSQKPEEPL
jgi:hypothetical protein